MVRSPSRVLGAGGGGTPARGNPGLQANPGMQANPGLQANLAMELITIGNVVDPLFFMYLSVAVRLNL